jgi:sacsin
MPPSSPREHVESIRRERYFIGREEQNPLAEDVHQAVNYLSQELYSKDVHFLMELVQVSKSCIFLEHRILSLVIWYSWSLAVPFV